MIKLDSESKIFCVSLSPPYLVLVCPHPLEYYAFALVKIVTPILDLHFFEAIFFGPNIKKNFNTKFS